MLPSPRSPTDTPERAPVGRPRLAWLWVVVIIIIGWNLLGWLQPSAMPAVLTYSDFVAAVRADKVASITMVGSTIEGTFREAQAWPPPTTARPVIGTPAPSTKLPVTAPSTQFTTIMPPTGDDRLLPLLDEHQVTITAKDGGRGTWLFDLLITALPTVLLIGLLIYLGRQAQQNQQSLFGFGSSRARQYQQHERPPVTLADVAGQDEAKAELREVVDFLKQPDRFRALGARLPRGVLLVGPPGTGKTLLARAVAGEASVPFFSISASEFVEMFVGVGASRVRDLFTRAKVAAPAIVFVDELDAVGRQRGAGLGGGHDEREQTLNQLLVELDGFDDQTNLIVLAATNRPDVLDPALLRPGRFDRQVTLVLPERAGRRAILERHTRHLPLGADVDLDQIARGTPGFSGADLANLANEAALMAARRGAVAIMGADIDAALEKIILGTRRAGLLNEAERRLVAYHESGHALVARLTPHADPVARVTIIPHGQSLGATQQIGADDRHNYPRDYLIGQLCVLLGGRAAEELVFGQPTSGAEQDLHQATLLARQMVGLWGMSDEVGPVWYGLGESHPFLGRELAQPRTFAEATAAELDRAVWRLIEAARRQAHDLLDHHRPALEALAAALLLHETIDGVTIDQLLASTTPPAPRADGASSASLVRLP